MQYFTLQAHTLKDAIDAMKRQYGDKARLLTHRVVRTGGFMGLFIKEGIEITGYLSDAPAPRRYADEDEKKKILDAVNKEQTMAKILREIKQIKVQLSGGRDNTAVSNPALDQVREILELNDFTPSFIRKIIGSLEKEFSIEALNDTAALRQSVLRRIGEQILIYPPFRFSKKKPIIYIVVGPTGVGKTTTIAKLAAIYGLGNKKQPVSQVRMITIDNYRIAAKKQIETYAEIMQIPVSFAETYNELQKAIALYQDVDLILIDTIGKSPADYEKLGEMKRILDACGTYSETHLAVSATTKASDVEDILRQFEPFMYKSVILTKLDETNRIGNIMSVLAEKSKPVSYITDGQVVPQDIEEATVMRFLMKLEGLRIDRDFIEKVFGKQDECYINNWR
ncbi:MAG: flagellar biosynthesis protein FlhF [Spirochaetales bacterium]|nr:flagellar biosynthesis protein FlhF [Spirochaetales bacterium]